MLATISMVHQPMCRSLLASGFQVSLFALPINSASVGSQLLTVQINKNSAQHC
jgi:hypothetical protein